MAHIRPFSGIRARSDNAAQVIAPPYDVLSEAEARAIASAKPQSFIHVTRSEVALPEGSDSHGPEAYAMARTQLERLLAEGVEAGLHDLFVRALSLAVSIHPPHVGSSEAQGEAASESVRPHWQGGSAPVVALAPSPCRT